MAAPPGRPRPGRNMRIDAALISRFSQAAHMADDAAGGGQPAGGGLLSRHRPPAPGLVVAGGVCAGAPVGADRREEGMADLRSPPEERLKSGRVAMGTSTVGQPATGISVASLRESVRGQLLTAGDEGYDQARVVHN